jgi:hypothetical protein
MSHLNAAGQKPISATPAPISHPDFNALRAAKQIRDWCQAQTNLPRQRQPLTNPPPKPIWSDLTCYQLDAALTSSTGSTGSTKGESKGTCNSNQLVLSNPSKQSKQSKLPSESGILFLLGAVL